jgi:hypothetical protein
MTTGDCFSRAWEAYGRDHLAGEPVHCGSMLKMLRDREWVWVRYEMTSSGRGYMIGPGDQAIRIDGTEIVRWPESWEK